ncbi:NAD(P)-binding protein [Hyaloscypha variabilis]
MSPYAAAHANPQGKVIVITGATSGIGLETARALATTGATLIITARDLKKVETSLSEILQPTRIFLVKMDNVSFTSIRLAASTILAQSHNQVNILINNAGVMGLQDLTFTEDGYEVHFATNHLSHFLLFQLLKPALLSSSSPTFHSRVINVASSAHRTHHLNTSDNYNFEKGGYHFMPAYSNSKLANIYMANELERRYASKGLHAMSLHPGAILTDLPRHLGPILKSLEQGAAATVIAAVGWQWEGRGGRYLEDCEEAKRGVDDGDGFGIGFVSQTYDPENEGRLWKDSLKIVGMEDDIA